MTVFEIQNHTISKGRVMNKRTRSCVCAASVSRLAVWTLSLAVMFFAFGCGSDSHHSNTGANYPAGISNDIGQQLKYDARVESFEPDGEDLIVIVNDSWMHSPPGMRERALGQWYSLWQGTHSKTSKILVKFDGNEVERWTAEKGYQPASKDDKAASE